MGIDSVTNAARSLRKTKPKGHHPDKALSAAFVPTAPPGRHADGNGLYLCVQPTGTRSGIVFTVDGAPSVVIELSVTSELTSGRLSGTAEGTVRWATDDDRRGSCRMDLDIAWMYDASGESSSLTGQACGHEIMDSGLGLLGFEFI